uniref:Hexose transporter 1 n=1 Tax=Pyrodinium bahamense TaxID=73915 RepID=A0A7R9ZYA5_9DINO|mmetsp:Transcript_14799/g.40904  ORF Transcript_14799/g.40904 Transcript_14799/m.40904 type:complete len:513 (+) Transcript_14799:228-1766(+)
MEPALVGLPHSRAKLGAGGGINGMLLLLGFNAAIGGFLFGYDTGSMSSALLQVKRPRNPMDACPGLAPHKLSSVQQELVISFVVLGAFLGAIASGYLNPYYGRRRLLIGASLLFIAGDCFEASAKSLGAMLVARVIVGLGVGISSHTVPLYIAECAPAHLRGSLCFLNDMMVTVGQVTSAFVSTMFFSWEVRAGWRWILGFAACPSSCMLVGFWFMPESPRWLISRGRHDEAKAILRSLRRLATEDQLEEEFHNTITGTCEETPLNDSQAGIGYAWERYVKDTRVRRALLLGCGLQCLQQSAGINTIMYYGASVLQKTGGNTGPRSCFSAESKQDVAITMLFAAGQLVGVFFSWLLVDRLGRRPLLLGSLVGVTVSLFATGCAFHQEFVNQGAVVVCILAYLVCFGAGLSPVPWTVNAEIYPLHVRAQCVSLSTCTNWSMNFIVSQTFLSLARALSLDPEHPKSHPDGIFLLYAGIASVGMVFAWFRMPETKGLSLEQIGDLFVAGEGLRAK